MTDLNANPVEVVAAGGFRMEIRPGELLVTEDRSAFDKNGKKRNWMLFVLWVVFILIPNLGSFMTYSVPYSLFSGHQILFGLCSLLVTAFLIAFIFIAASRGKPTLRCTSEVLEILYVFRGQLRRRQTFALSEIKNVRYDEGPSIIAANSGRLRFTAGKCDCNCLSGLKAVEAQRILDELRKMGFDTVRDPGLPMLLEMEQSRRKHPFRLLP